jgi:hypothetical protein
MIELLAQDEAIGGVVIHMKEAKRTELDLGIGFDRIGVVDGQRQGEPER